MFLRSDKGKDELLEQKEFTNSLLNEESISTRDEIVMSFKEEPIIVEDKEKMACMNGQ